MRLPVTRLILVGVAAIVALCLLAAPAVADDRRLGGAEAAGVRRSPHPGRGRNGGPRSAAGSRRGAGPDHCAGPARGDAEAQIAFALHRQNPDPKVATLHFGPAAGNGGERSFSTRVRIDTFSHVRAVLETEDGVLHMATRFVAAAGGCGAMQAKDPDAETVNLGKMVVKTFPPALDANPIWSAQVMIKHPNSNGMQLDIHTANIIPARYVNKVIVKRGGELVFDMDGTFSISTNPNFRFTFGRGADNSLDVAITDTDGTKFAAQSEPSGS